jgi:leader peptidase (prepilin peptidase)/N-methyltransferase
MDFILSAYAFLFGLIMGSFLNVCVYRIPLAMSLVRPHSACPQCKTQIKFYDNIPVLSYLWLGGKCRNCGARISLQYPIVELLTGFLTVLFFRRFGYSYWTAYVLTAVYALIILSAIDFKIREIPDGLSIGLAAFGLLVSFFNPAFSGGAWQKFLSALIASAAGFFGLLLTALAGQKLLKKEAMGGGDIKLMAGIGALSGIGGVVNALLLASFTGILYFGILVLLRKKIDDGAIPFGPFLSLGLTVNLYYPTKFFLVL